MEQGQTTQYKIFNMVKGGVIASCLLQNLACLVVHLYVFAIVGGVFGEGLL
jgi:hypothetical protein